ncbi:hypothetical protein F4778DRAFT_185814 [Xylariomycetidae sp. FL2044]|nr:hypothetical protein F4778DRAFT_185814 [Xylariomycetidae sp. FL2044]
MYIPRKNEAILPSRLVTRQGFPSTGVVSWRHIIAHHDRVVTSNSILVTIQQFFSRHVYSLGSSTDRLPSVGKRTPVEEMNTTIGIVVGVLLSVFVIAIIAFLYVYRESIRFKKGRRRRRHHHKSSSSKSSAEAPQAPAE